LFRDIDDNMIVVIHSIFEIKISILFYWRKEKRSFENIYRNRCKNDASITAASFCNHFTFRILFSSKVKLTVRFERFKRNGSYLIMQIKVSKSFFSSIKRNDSSN